jgi:hypothetical protein
VSGTDEKLQSSTADADSNFSDQPPGSTIAPCLKPEICFIRGIIFALPERQWPWLVTKVVAPLPAPVVRRLQKYKKRPLDSELVRVCVSKVAAKTAQITGGPKACSVPLKSEESEWRSVKKILCWYGDGRGIDPDHWPDIQLVEVTAGGASPFVSQLTGTALGVSAPLGMIDILVTDPDEGDVRSLRYCLLRSRTPVLKLLLPLVDVTKIRVIVDDGDNDTPDTVDITKKVGLSGAVTVYSAVPDWVDETGGGLDIHPNQDQGRLRKVIASVLQGEPDAGRYALFMSGENRVRLEYDRPEGGGTEILYHAHSLNYLDRNKTIVNGYFEEESAGEGGCVVKKGTILFDYKDDTPGLQMTSVLHALRFRPQALSPHFRIVEARSQEDLAYPALQSLRDEISGFNDEILESVTISAIHPHDPVSPEMSESIPRALHGDFSGAPARIFNNANLHWHHFVIHTFPALRLIESQLFPRRRPTVVRIVGFDHNKTFIGPGSVSGLQQLIATNTEEGGSKMALFGCTESGSGTTDEQNQLSQRRAKSLYFLLTRDLGWWFDQFCKGTEACSHNTRELEFAMMRLGLYAGPISGASNPNLTSALRTFESNEGLAHPASGWGPTAGTRVRIAKRLRKSINSMHATATIKPDIMWGTLELQAMLVQLGHLGGAFHAGVNDQPTIDAAKAFQQSKSLTDDGIIGLCTRIALIEDYMTSLVDPAIAADRFYTNAQFGCGIAQPADPAGPGANPLDNRVDVVFRASPIQPIDPTVFAEAVPYHDWIRELDDDQLPEIPKVVVAVTDSGLGAGENFSGVQQRKLLNNYHIRGDRIVRPTNIIGIAPGNANTAVVRADGDLTTITDATPNGGHGSCVMTCMLADGIGALVGGAARNQANVAIGVAPHVKLRPIKHNNSVLSALVNLELLAGDPEVLVHSTSSHLYTNPNAASAFFVSAQQFRAIEQRTQDFTNQGKVVFASAGNYRGNGAGFIAFTYDTATRQWGRNAVERTTSRSAAAYSGAQQFRQSVCIVGSSAEVGPAGSITTPNTQDTGANHTYIGEQVSIHTPGENIRAVTAAVSGIAGNLTNPSAVIGNTIVGGIGGTSFATPMTAGIAAELMLLDPNLRQRANMPRVIEYIEATAEPLPNLNPAGGSGAAAGNTRAADPGPPAGVPPNGLQPPNLPAAYQNIRRVNYWKAVLAALNQGLSAEDANHNGADGAQDGFFQFCTLRRHANTKWYGFEFRSFFPGSLVWLRAPVQPCRFRLISSRPTLHKGEQTTISMLPALSFPGKAEIRLNGTLIGQIGDPAAAPVPLGDVGDFTVTGIGGSGSVTLTAKKNSPSGTVSYKVSYSEPRPCAEAEVQYVFGGAAPAAAPAAQTGGRYQLAQDAGAMLPGNATIAAAWISADNHQSAPNRPLPFFPWTQATLTAAGVTPQYLCQMSLPKARLDKADAIELHLPDNDPNRPTAPPLLSIPLTNFGNLRTPTAQPAASAIRSFVDAFDDFVFHCRDNPKVLSALMLFCAKGTTDVAVGEKVDILIYCVEAFGFVANLPAPPPAPVISHNGTAGAGPAVGVFLNGAAAPQAGVPYAFGGDPTKPFMARVQFTGNTAEPVTLTAVDGAGHSGTITLNVLNTGALARFGVTIRARGGARLWNNPPHANDPLEVEVVAFDMNNLVVTGFAGPVQMVVAQGTMGSAVGRTGVHMKNADADPFDPAAFTYIYNGGNRGVHVYNFFNYSAGPLQLKATAGPVEGTSNEVQTLGGPLASFNIEAPATQNAGQSVQIVVTALDAAGSRIEDFVGAVTIAIHAGAGTAPATAADGTRSGVFLDNPTYAYERPDAGRHTFSLTCYTAEAVQIDASSGGITSTSAVIQIQAGGVLHHFRLDVSGGERAGRTLNVKVVPEDVNNAVLTNFAGAVTLNVTTGTAFAAGPPQRGVRVENAPGVLGNNHNFVTGDNGEFVFLVIPFSVEAVQLTTSSGGINSTSRMLNIASDVFANFVVAVGAIPAGGAISTVSVTAQDAYGNTDTNFMGNVVVNVRQGAAGAWTLAAQYTFTSADAGVHVFNAVAIPAGLRGPNLFVQVTDGNTVQQSGPFNGT